jgi:spermidine synthase
MRILLLLLLLTPTVLMAAKVIHKEKSLYGNIVVNQKANKRCLVFSVKRQLRNQTCIDLKDPDRIIFPYVRMTFAGLLLNQEPKRALMIGLGGGTISRVLTRVYPDLQLDLVEVDGAVVKVAKDYFGFVETDNTQVHVVDGRVFVKRAALKNEQYDLVILDAFTGEYIPEHLMTVEFMQEIQSLLTPDGVVVANTFSGSALYDHESVTYTSVFGAILNLKMPGTGNRVIVASNAALPDYKTLMASAKQLTPLFEAYGIEMTNLAMRLDRKADWDSRKRPLTDQFSPANLLRAR